MVIVIEHLLYPVIKNRDPFTKNVKKNYLREIKPFFKLFIVSQSA
jgi:hypothetical protein